MSQKSPLLKKKKRKTLDLNRTVLLSQMKERVEAAFVAREQDKSENVAEIYSANHATSPIENNEDVIVTPGDDFTEKPYSEEEESEEKNMISRKTIIKVLLLIIMFLLQLVRNPAMILTKLGMMQN